MSQVTFEHIVDRLSAAREAVGRMPTQPSLELTVEEAVFIYGSTKCHALMSTSADPQNFTMLGVRLVWPDGFFKSSNIGREA